jgi:hypothetical protein
VLDIQAAKADCSGRPNQIALNALDSNADDVTGIGVNLTLPPGVYSSGGFVVINPSITLSLDAGNDVNAVWIFNCPAGLEIDGIVTIVNHPTWTAGGNVPAPVFWNVDGSDENLDSVFLYDAASVGTVLSKLSIYIQGNSGNSAGGALLALNKVQFKAGTTNTAQAYSFPNGLTFPSATPSAVSSTIPTAAPTHAPSTSPSAAPTNAHTQAPTVSPTENLSAAPTRAPSAAPSLAPTHTPSQSPSAAPSHAPSTAPTVGKIT